LLKAHRLLNIDRGDFPKLGQLAPIFAATSAATVVLATLAKALFLSANPIVLLPWMFLGSSAITAGLSLGYVAAMRRLGLSLRFFALLLVAAGSFVALRAAFPLSPARFGMVILLWCPAAGHLLLMQTWNLASTLLPTRQGKRLLPVLAAVTTLGAALGGWLVQLLLRWVSAEDLLVAAAALAALPLWRVRGVITRLGGPARERDEAEPARKAPARIAGQPMLVELATLSFLLQGASLIIDYQFSAELKPALDKDGIASFLGAFYGASNLVVLCLTLLFTSRFIRLAGIGVALAMSGIVLGVGSAVYAVARAGALPGFWIIAATAFGERVAQYAFSRPAAQMLYMPLSQEIGERAKTLVDGVVHRVATAVVSVLLLVTAPSVADQFRLSPAAALACAVVLYLGVRIGPQYRQALLAALRARRIDPTTARYLQAGLSDASVIEVERKLASPDPATVLSALEVARELALALEPERLEQLALHDDERVACAAVRALQATGRPPGAELLEQMLAGDRPPRVLRAILQLLSESGSDDLARVARPLASHPDAGVASAACVARIRAAGGVERFEDEIASPPQRSAAVSAGRVTGMTRAGEFARELAELAAHPSAEVRRDAIEQMSQLGLPYFIAPLIGCLGRPNVRKEAMQALVRFGARALPRLRDHLGAAELSLAAQMALLDVIERLASREAVAALVEVCRSRADGLCDHAVESLWRLGADPAAPHPDKAELGELCAAEVSRLEVYSAIEMLLLGRLSPRRAMFVRELAAQQQAAERRAFRLLALIYNREAMQRAYLHYRSAQSRARSNAIELLEQHIDGLELKPFVALIERQEDAHGGMRPRSLVVQKLADHGSVDALLENEPWLARVWGWAASPGHDREARGDVDWDDPLDRLLRLKELPMFAGLRGPLLLPLSNALRRRQLAAGDAVFAEEDGRQVYWVLEGEVRLSLASGRALALGRHECFGLVAALDGGGRCGRARAVADAVVAELAHDDFEDALDLDPALMRALIGLLSQRLREAIA
jgi:HEAT repeat protein